MTDQTNLKSFLRTHPTLIRVFISLLAVFVTLLGMEAAFFVLDKIQTRGSQISITTSQNLYQRDELLAASPKPNVEVLVEKKLGENTLYAVTYAIDQYSRRITPMENPPNRSRFILFFGGSFTFGEGVEQDETLPFYVSDASAQKAYNYGFFGYGPQQMLAKLQSDEFVEEIDEPDGILVYTFLDHHVNRAVGTMRIYQFALGGDYPNYVLQEDGTLALEGTFAAGRPGLTLFYRLLGKSQTLQYFNLDFPPINEKHIQTTARIIEAARDTFVEKYPGNEFYVLLFPNRSNQYGPRLIPYLEDAGIGILDYSDAIQDEEGMWIPVDGHPTPQMYRMVAEMLVKDLGID